MLRPTLHLDLNTCVLSIAVQLMEMLHTGGAARYADVCARVESKYGPQGRVQLPLALSLLYLLGLAEYDGAADALLLVNDMKRGHE